MKRHEKILQSINPNLVINERFTGGMSNFTYLVTNQNSNVHYTFRIPGMGAQNFVNFYVERKNLSIIDELNINSHAVYTDPSTGLKISTYIPGNMVDENINLTAVSDLLKKLHNSKLQLANNYNHLERLQSYEALHHNHHFKYIKLKTEFLTVFNQYLEQHIHYPCHNDAQVANMILGTNKKLYLLDWEFSATNDFVYDIASFGNKNFEMAENLIKVYFENPTADIYVRLYGWRLFQCLQWYNVASYKAEIGLGDDLNIDFTFVADNYLKLAQVMLNNINKHLI